MKKLFCICILTCLLLTSCGGGGEDLNVYTTEPRTETNALQPSIGAADTTAENIAVKTPDIPEELREYVVNFIDKVDYLETDSYEVDKGKLRIDVIVRKSDLLKLDKFIHKVVADYGISNYEFKKVSESKLEDSDEL